MNGVFELLTGKRAWWLGLPWSTSIDLPSLRFKSHFYLVLLTLSNKKKLLSNGFLLSNDFSTVQTQVVGEER